MEDPNKRGSYIPDTSRTVIAANDELAIIENSDTAVDSYALTANGDGAGYVTLLFGNGEAFTPRGEPVSVEIIKVIPELYTGDLKNLAASNPLDEQTTLRHSGDFAARPGNYEFDWRYAAPQDGVAPVTYLTEMTTVLGAPESLDSRRWQLAVDPLAAYPLESDYGSQLYEFSRSLGLA